MVLGNLNDDDFVLMRRCLPNPMWSVLPHVVMEARHHLVSTESCTRRSFGARQICNMTLASILYRGVGDLKDVNTTVALFKTMRTLWCVIW